MMCKQLSASDVQSWISEHPPTRGAKLTSGDPSDEIAESVGWVDDAGHAIGPWVTVRTTGHWCIEAVHSSKRHGPAMYFGPDNSLWEIYFFDRDVRHGPHVVFDPAGPALRGDYFVEGEPSDEYTVYRPSGMRHMTVRRTSHSDFLVTEYSSKGDEVGRGHMKREGEYLVRSGAWNVFDPSAREWKTVDFDTAREVADCQDVFSPPSNPNSALAWRLAAERKDVPSALPSLVEIHRPQS